MHPNVKEQDQNAARQLDKALQKFDGEVRCLLGIADGRSREALVHQLIESVRRNEFIRRIATRHLSDARTDPRSDLFDPLRAAMVMHRRGELDEAFWLVFLATHCGKHRRMGWVTTRAIYGRVELGPVSSWARTSRDVAEFRDWLDANRATIPSRFGNHRKYESLDARSQQGTGEVVESYVHWVGGRSHIDLIAQEQAAGATTPQMLFDRLYSSMSAVRRFGRTARFDYLTMLGKIGLAPIEPGRVYMEGATGPLRGARLLFGGNIAAAVRASDAETWLIELDRHLGVGAQALEDALCNWQKSPERFLPFRG